MILTRDGKEITAIYKQDGNEIEEVKDANGRLVYSASREITGTLPLNFSGRGKPLTDYLISGDTLQNGTPTPGAPVDVVGCGVKTGNLFDQSSYALIQVTSTAYRCGTSLGVLPQGTYTFNATKSAGAQSIYLTAKLNGAYSQTTISSVPFSFTADGDSEYIIRTANSTGTTWEAEKYSDMMLNLGSTALPYEPYGYKLPITVNGTEYPIYLGQVPTTRSIRKLVLTGEENITLHNVRNDIAGVRIPTPTLVATDSPLICSHAINVSMNTYFFMRSYNVVAVSDTAGLENVYMSAPDDEHNTLSGIKSYLAQQYAAGTPVTVWYVLAEPETGIINEPMHKIGDYSDTISYAQAGVTLPTIAGSNVLAIGTTVQPSAVSITGNIKPTGYGQLLDSQDVEIYDKYSTPIHIHG